MTAPTEPPAARLQRRDGVYDVSLISSYRDVYFAGASAETAGRGPPQRGDIARPGAIHEGEMHEHAAYAIKALIAFHVEADDSGFVHNGQLFDLADLGAMPNIGDRIVYPGIVGMPQGGGESPPRIVYEVVGRDFLGRESEAEPPRIALFVRTEIVAEAH